MGGGNVEKKEMEMENESHFSLFLLGKSAVMLPTLVLPVRLLLKGDES